MHVSTVILQCAYYFVLGSDICIQLNVLVSIFLLLLEIENRLTGLFMTGGGRSELGPPAWYQARKQVASDKRQANKR